MGCTYAIEAHGADAARLAAATEAALDEVDRIDRLMSDYRPDSALSHLNREAARGPVVVEPELLSFLQRCQHLARASGGAFDVTVGPLLQAWGFFEGDGHLPTPTARARALAAVGHQKVVIDPAAGTARFARPGMRLDLGGIGKGHAVDRAVAVLRRHGVASALVSAGGSTLFALGHPTGAPAWSIQLQLPVDPQVARDAGGHLLLRDQAVSVSGAAGRSFVERGVRYGHVLDPRTGWPVQTVQAVVVIGPTGTDTDAFDQVLSVLGPERGFAILPAGYRAMVVLKSGRVVRSPGPAGAPAAATTSNR